MIATPNLDEIIGAEVVDPNNDTVGKVGRIYLDSDRDVPTWITVKTGLFGLAETLVPVDDATWEGNVLHVGVDKARIKDAPRVDVDQEIAPEDQQRLYSYYDRDVPGAGTGDYGTTNDVGVLWPPGRAPVTLAIYLSGASPDAKPRNDIVAQAAAIVAGWLG